MIRTVFSLMARAIQLGVSLAFLAAWEGYEVSRLGKRTRETPSRAEDD